MKDLIFKLVLENAVRYNGKPNQKAVIGKILAERPNLKKEITKIAKEVNEAVGKVKELTLEEQTKKLKQIAPEFFEKKRVKKEKELPGLKNVKGNIVMRLAPYPSGPLHIGNTKTYVANDYYVKRYGGKLLLVMDDTIGSETKNITNDAYSLIPDGLKWLDVKFDENIVYKSDRLEIYYEYAEKLIKADKAYVCFCKQDVLRNNRAKGIVCPCRTASIQKNLDEWKKMFDVYKEGEAVLRIKTSMEHPNPAFRDRVLFRISDREHPRIGKKYKVWPLLEFSWAIDDYLLGITHILRGKDLMMESEMESYIWDIFKWPKPELLHTGLVQIEGVKISKSKSSEEVKKGVYSGWDDPRTWSLQSLKRRGILPEAVRNFSLSFGLNMNEIVVPVENLYAENRKLLDPIAKRFFFIENPKEVVIKNAPNLEVELDLHPEMCKGGRRFVAHDKFYIPGKLMLEDNVVYRFMNLFNFQNKEFISKEHDPKLKPKMLHWLPVETGNVKVEVLMPDAVIKKGLAEKGVLGLKVGDIVQFERFGFCRLDKIENNKLIFWFAHK